MSAFDEMLKPALILLLCFACFHTANAGIYKWVDDNGQVHYGERPAGEAAERMQLQIREPVARQKDEDEKAEASAPAAPQPAAEEGEWVEQPLSSREKRQRCTSARQRLQTIQSRARLKVTDASGQVRALSPKERDARIKQIRKDIRQYCR